MCIDGGEFARVLLQGHLLVGLRHIQLSELLYTSQSSQKIFGLRYGIIVKF